MRCCKVCFAEKVHRNFGIRNDRAVRYNRDRRGIELNYRVVSETITDVRMRREIQEDWDADIRKDAEHRKEGQ